MDFNPLQVLQQEIVACERCPRLRAYCAEIATAKRRAFREWDYWGRPVPSFGDPAARVLVLGLAPAAHGANRTGRMFTGDRSGDFLYGVLHATGFASQPTAAGAADGLRLSGLYITAAAHCAPPGNRPAPEELRACRPYLARELDLLPRLRVVVALGRIAFDTYLDLLRERRRISTRAAYPFAHGCEYRIAPDLPALIGSYHPSQQNTQTGRLTEPMLRAVFKRARAYCSTRRLFVTENAPGTPRA